ncbi:hypothetical protein R1sor_014280 [Riccia sorocarpa]|uniref:Uncharacterized protein n=1 Tax=Riccia sorocarpa TaxID=122646 RepID=A0ABD3HD47_9MARC
MGSQSRRQRTIDRKRTDQLVFAKHLIMSLKEQHIAKLLLANLSNGLQTVKGTHTRDDMIAKRCVVKWIR